MNAVKSVTFIETKDVGKYWTTHYTEITLRYCTRKRILRYDFLLFCLSARII